VEHIEEVTSSTMTVASQNFRTGDPTFYPTFDKKSTSDRKKRIREHASPPMKNKMQKVGQEHQIVGNKWDGVTVVPIIYLKFHRDGPICSPTIYRTFDEKHFLNVLPMSPPYPSKGTLIQRLVRQLARCFHSLENNDNEWLEETEREVTRR